MLRTVLPLGRVDMVVGPEDRRDVYGQQVMRARTPSRETQQYEQMQAFIGKKKPSETENICWAFSTKAMRPWNTPTAIIKWWPTPKPKQPQKRVPNL